MTLYELIMGNGTGAFTKEDWSALGKGEIMDSDTVRKMLMEGYEAVGGDE